MLFIYKGKYVSLPKFPNFIETMDTPAEKTNIYISDYNKKIPQDRDTLQKLPGVGRKTANVVLNNAFGQPTIGVDTHVFRVSNRLGIAPGKNVIQVEKKLEKNIPDIYKLHAHHWLILLGRYTCIARKPQCYKCSVIDFCDYKNKVLKDD